MLVFRPFKPLTTVGLRCKSSKAWLKRAHLDPFSKKARLESLKSRAAYKLKEIQSKYRIFQPGQTVVDLGYAPGSWSQIAQKFTSPGGRVIGVDLQLAEPPLGVTTIQGNFLDPVTQLEIETILASPERGRFVPEHSKPRKDFDLKDENTYKADVVISDMCGIWPITSGLYINSINTSHRLANTSGIEVKDHTSSMDLCDAALVFAIKNLRKRGSFVCKFYTGSEDNDLEARLKKVFTKVHRVKPMASRTESKEAFFVALGKKNVLSIESVFT